MTKLQWKRRIQSACESAGTYQPFYDDMINTLAQILESRDSAHDQFIEHGGKPTIVHTNQAHEENIAKNPMLTLEMELNTQALAYWRELGLTVKSFKQLNAEENLQRATGGFEKLLSKLAD